MSRIVEEIRTAGKKIRVAFDSGDFLFLSIKTFNQLNLKEGQELSDKDYENILKENVYPLAKRKALDILTRSDRTEKELREKLSHAGFGEEAVDYAIMYVKGFHYIDDRKYAKNYTEYKAFGMSNARLGVELRRRGISPEVIEDCLKGRREEEILKKQLYKKMDLIDISNERKLNKIKSFFYREGFSISDINGLMREYMDSVEE